MAESKSYQNQIQEPQEASAIISTPRLILRDLTAADAPALFRYRSMPEVTKFQGWTPVATEDAVRFVEKEICHVMDQPDTWFQLGIFLRDGQILIGDMGLHFLGAGDSGEGNPRASDTVEIGITVAPDFQGKGFAAEAVGHGLKFLFEELGKEKVVASVDPLNEKSMDLMKRVGFHLEGIHKDACLFRGRWTDDAVFSMTRKQWKKTPKPSA